MAECKSMKAADMTQMQTLQYAKVENPIRMSHSKARYIGKNSDHTAGQPTMECKSRKVMRKIETHTFQYAKV
jgi:hypothetical protein